MTKRSIEIHPDVPPGPQHEYFSMVLKLVLDAGDPTVATLGEKVNVSRQVVHRALRGPGLPSRDLMLRIVGALQDELLKLEELPTPSSAVTRATIVKAFNAAVADHRARRLQDTAAYVPERKTGVGLGTAPAREEGEIFWKKPRTLRGPPTAREELARNLTKMFEAAGNPTLKRVVSRANSLAVETGSRRRLSIQRLSDWRAGRNVPAEFDSLQLVLSTLIDIANRRGSGVPSSLMTMGEWHTMWRDAVLEAQTDGEE